MEKDSQGAILHVVIGGSMGEVGELIDNTVRLRKGWNGCLTGSSATGWEQHMW